MFGHYWADFQYGAFLSMKALAINDSLTLGDVFVASLAASQIAVLGPQRGSVIANRENSIAFGYHTSDCSFHAVRPNSSQEGYRHEVLINGRSELFFSNSGQKSILNNWLLNFLLRLRVNIVSSVGLKSSNISAELEIIGIQYKPLELFFLWFLKRGQNRLMHPHYTNIGSSFNNLSLLYGIDRIYNLILFPVFDTILNMSNRSIQIVLCLNGQLAIFEVLFLELPDSGRLESIVTLKISHYGLKVHFIVPIKHQDGHDYKIKFDLGHFLEMDFHSYLKQALDEVRQKVQLDLGIVILC